MAAPIPTKSVFHTPLVADRPEWLRATLHALIAVAASWLIITLPVVLGGVLAGHEGVGPGNYLRVGTLVWLAAQGVTLHSPLGPMTMLPWLLTPVIAVVVRWTQLPLLRHGGQAPRSHSAEEWAGGPAMVRLAIHVIVYAAATVSLTAMWGTVDGWEASPVRTSWVIPLFITLIAATVLITPHVVTSVVTSLDVPRIIRDGCTRAVRVLAVLAACGALVVAAAALMHGSELAQAQTELATGFGEHTALIFAQLLYLPTLIVWGVSWLVGTGFELGAGSLVQPGSGVLLDPFLPILAATPRPDETPAWAWSALAVPMLIGAWTGWGVNRRWGHAPLVRRCGVVVQIAGLAGLGVGFAAWAASGALGISTLRRLGPDPVLTATALICEMVVPAVIVVLVGHLLDRSGVTGVGLRRIPDDATAPAPTPARPAADHAPASSTGHRRPSHTVSSQAVSPQTVSSQDDVQQR